MSLEEVFRFILERQYEHEVIYQDEIVMENGKARAKEDSDIVAETEAKTNAEAKATAKVQAITEAMAKLDANAGVNAEQQVEEKDDNTDDKVEQQDEERKIYMIKIFMECPQVENDEGQQFECDIYICKLDNGMQITLHSNFSIVSQQTVKGNAEEIKNKILFYEDMMKGNGGDFSELKTMISEMLAIENALNNGDFLRNDAEGDAAEGDAEGDEY